MSLPAGTQEPVRTVVVCNGRAPCRRLAPVLARDPGLDVTECASAEEAVRVLSARPAELVFLRMHSRGLDDVSLVEAPGTTRLPVVVFTGACSGDHALKAFEAGALDYVAEPIGEERLAAAVARAKALVRLRRLEAASERLVALLTARKPLPGESISHPHQFLVRSGRSTYFVDSEAVDWVESADNYARLWSCGRSHLVRYSMRRLEQSLAPIGFVRVHRTAIANVRRVREVRLQAPASHVVVLSSGHHLPLSRERRRAVLEALRERGLGSP